MIAQPIAAFLGDLEAFFTGVCSGVLRRCVAILLDRLWLPSGRQHRKNALAWAFLHNPALGRSVGATRGRFPCKAFPARNEFYCLQTEFHF